MLDFEKLAKRPRFLLHFSCSNTPFCMPPRPVVWSVEWLAEPDYARQDRVMAVHNGATEALDS